MTLSLSLNPLDLLKDHVFRVFSSDPFRPILAGTPTTPSKRRRRNNDIGPSPYAALVQEQPPLPRLHHTRRGSAATAVPAAAPARRAAQAQSRKEGTAAERRRRVVTAAAMRQRQQDRDVAGGPSLAVAIATLDAPLHVGIGFRTQFPPRELPKLRFLLLRVLCLFLDVLGLMHLLYSISGVSAAFEYTGRVLG